MIKKTELKEIMPKIYEEAMYMRKDIADKQKLICMQRDIIGRYERSIWGRIIDYFSFSPLNFRRSR